MTSLTSIFWTDKLDSNPKDRSFVFHKLLQLVKAPSRYHSIQMFIPCLCSASNIFKLFHADRSAIVPFRFFDELFRKNMVFLSNPPFFLAGDSFKYFFSAFRSFGLKACSNLGSLFFKNLSRLAFYFEVCRSCCNIREAQIDPHQIFAHTEGFFTFNDHVDIPTIRFSKHSRRGWVFPLQRLS